MKKKTLLFLFTLLIILFSSLTVFASDSANELKSSIIKKAPLSEKNKNTTGKTNAYGDINDPVSYPLVAPNSYAGNLIDSRNTTHSVNYISILQDTDSSKIDLKLIITTNDYVKDMYYSEEFYNNINGQLNYVGNVEFTINSTYNTWTLTSQLPKSVFSDQQYVYIRLGVSADYYNDYYSDTLLFKVENPYYVPPVDYTALNNFITRFYQLCLNRTPDQTGLDFWVNGLAAKTYTGADVAYHFIFSPEFINMSVNDDQFINIMYKAFFNRDPDSSGKAYWLDRLISGDSRLFVLSSFVNSPEFNTICSNYGINRGTITLTKPADLYPNITEFVYRLYVKCLQRKPDDTGLNYYVGELAAGRMTGLNTAYHFIFCPEFEGRNLSNNDFITIMYRVFFNREPDAAGAAYHISNLNAGGTRLNEFYIFVNSAEFAKVCSNYGIKVK